ncbi:MAG: glycosyltransferase [Nanoarchaeota archaeon]|nr:glycosyltransferase [Nanoarchaeota archaeon]
MAQSKDSKIRELSDKITIATTTFYNPNLEDDIHRAKIAKNSIRTANNLGYEIVIVDGGSSEELLKEFEKYGARVYSQTSKGMGKSRRQAIREAYNIGREVVAWAEPEKESYISQIVKTAEPIIKDSADLVVPKRKSLESYPAAQQYAEPLGNLFWKDLTGYDLDMWFGPRTWKKEISDYFLNYNGEYGDLWDSIFIPVMNAIIDGKKIISINVEYTHPKKQTEMEEHDLKFHWKRIKQLNNLMPNLETHWRKISQNQHK